MADEEECEYEFPTDDELREELVKQLVSHEFIEMVVEAKNYAKRVSHGHFFELTIASELESVEIHVCHDGECGRPLFEFHLRGKKKDGMVH